MKLILPLAGSSSRYGLARPKWMLTMPSGKLMIEEAIQSLDLSNVDEIILVPQAKHLQGVITEHVLTDLISALTNKHVTVFPLSHPTSSQSETVAHALLTLDSDSPFFVKDSDNTFAVTPLPSNSVCFSTLYSSPECQASNKSYIAFDSLNTIHQIVEKRVISDTFCVGGYSFRSSALFLEAFQRYQRDAVETYLSNIIFDLIAEGEVFRAIPVQEYEDWGTIDEYRQLQRQAYTIFSDFDGVIVENSSKFAHPSWQLKPILPNIEALKVKLSHSPYSKLVITTSRPQAQGDIIREFLSNYSLYPSHIVTDLPHCQRLLINDFSATNPYPTASSISVPRDTTSLAAYLGQH